MLETTQVLSTLHTGKIPEYLKEEQRIQIQIPNKDSLEVTVRTEQFCTGLFKIYYSWEKSKPVSKNQITQLTLKKLIKAPMTKRERLFGKEQILFHEHVHTFSTKFDFSFIAGKPLRLNIDHQPIYAEFKILKKSNSQNISKVQAIFVSLDNKDLNPKSWEDFSLKVRSKASNKTTESVLQKCNNIIAEINKADANQKELDRALDKVDDSLDSIADKIKKRAKTTRRIFYISMLVIAFLMLYLVYRGMKYLYKKIPSPIGEIPYSGVKRGS